jgi:predicted ArsR family transcriptional regulator
MVTLEEKKTCITKILKRYGKELEDLIKELEDITNDTKFNEFFEELGELLAKKNIVRELSECLNKYGPDNPYKVTIN